MSGYLAKTKYPDIFFKFQNHMYIINMLAEHNLSVILFYRAKPGKEIEMKYKNSLPIDDWYSMKEKEYNERMAAEAESRHNLIVLCGEMYNDVVDMHLNDNLNEYASNDEYFDRKVSTGTEITRDDMLSYVSRVNQLVQVSNRFDEIVKDFFKIKYKVILKDSTLNSATLNESNVASQLDREALEIEEEFVKSIYPDDAYKTDIIRNFVNSDYRKFTYVAVILSAYANLKQAIDRYSIKEDS